MCCANALTVGLLLFFNARLAVAISDTLANASLRIRSLSVAATESLPAAVDEFVGAVDDVVAVVVAGEVADAAGAGMTVGALVPT